MLEDPDKLRSIYRSITEAGDLKAGLTPQMRSLLENLAIEDPTSERGLEILSAFVAAPVEARDDIEALAKAAQLILFEREQMRIRIATLKLK